MAKDPKARLVVIRTDTGGRKGSLTMARGLAEGLGFSAQDMLQGTTEISLPSKQITRHLWAGGPAVTVNRPAQVTTRQLGSGTGVTKTAKKLMLRDASGSVTLYYTGRQSDAVAKLKPRVDAETLDILSSKGKLIYSGMAPDQVSA